MSVFDIPDSCINAPECVVFADGGDDSSEQSKKPAHGHGHGHGQTKAQ